MPYRGRRRLFAGLGLLLGSCLLSSGCESLPQLPLVSRRATPEVSTAASGGWRERATAPVHRAPPDVLQPQSVVYWSAVPGAGSLTRGYRGRSTVGSDGSISVGPYGTVHVAGLTQEQAKVAVSRQVAQHVRDPRVAVLLTPPHLEGEAVAHNMTPRGGSTVLRTGHTAAAGPSLTDGSTPPAENRLVPAPNPTLTVSPRDDVPAIIEPPSSPELPFPRAANSYPAWQCNGQFSGGPGRAPNEMNMVALPPYIIGVTDILLIEYKPPKKLEGEQPIAGQHFVNPDGTVHLGTYGQVRVAGLTLEVARQAIIELIRPRDNAVEPKFVNVDILAYNSKKYYVITDGAGYGEQVHTFPVTGNDTVLDAIGLIGGLPPVASKRQIWVARRNPNGGFDSVLPVDWNGIAQRGATSTNYQLMPGDRLYVQSDKWRRADSNVQKVLAPFERILGATLLGASTVQTIRGNQSGVGGR